MITGGRLNTQASEQTDDYVRAAAFFNTCRAAGVQGSSVDLLICSVAHRYAVPILTTDRDVVRYTELLPVSLVEGIVA